MNILTTDEAAAYIGKSRRWLVREGVRKHGLDFIRPPGTKEYLFEQHVLDAWLRGGKNGGPSEDVARLAERVVHVIADRPGITKPEVERVLRKATKPKVATALDLACRQRKVKRKRDGRGAYTYYPVGW